MPDALDTRAALRELVLMLARHEVNMEVANVRYAELTSLADRLDAAAPPPPARTVTRAQYHNAVEMLAAFRHSNSLATPGQLAGEILTALDLRVADDDTEAPRA